MAKKKTGKKAAKKTAKKTNAKAKPAKKSPKKGKRYGEKRKQTLLAKYNELRAAGETAQAAAKKVGVPYITLRSWEKKAGGKVASTKRKALKKAVASKRKTRTKKAAAKKPSPAARGGITLVTPNGFRIEGISSGELISVLKALK